MRWYVAILILLIFVIAACKERQGSKNTSLFNGESFAGWEGDTAVTWRVENGSIVGGSLDSVVPNNDFLCTSHSYANFILNLKIKLMGTEGFINSGIQFRSKRLDDPSYEMSGYQADWGEGYWASLYDESRRNKTLMAPDSTQILDWIALNDWNDYEIRAEDRRIRLFINGHQTIDYMEEDLTIPQAGLICFQIHGGGKAQVWFKDITLTKLP